MGRAETEPPHSPPLSPSSPSEQVLLRRAEVAWHKHGLANTDILFGYAKARLDKVSVEDWLMLLMRVMIMEYNQLL